MKEKKMAARSTIFGVTLLLGAFLSAISTPVQAQPQPYGTRSSSTGASPPKETMRRILHSMPANIPVPIPPDAKFVMGYQTQYTTSKPITFLRITSSNSGAALIDWYRKSLVAYGWTANPNEQAGKHATMIYATRQNVACSIDIATPVVAAKTSGTPIMIRYNEL